MKNNDAKQHKLVWHITKLDKSVITEAEIDELTDEFIASLEKRGMLANGGVMPYDPEKDEIKLQVIGLS